MATRKYLLRHEARYCRPQFGLRFKLFGCERRVARYVRHLQITHLELSLELVKCCFLLLFEALYRVDQCNSYSS